MPFSEVDHLLRSNYATARFPIVIDSNPSLSHISQQELDLDALILDFLS